jgi:leader peptidase (prepilin peptidase) / N-methyltransferase
MPTRNYTIAIAYLIMAIAFGACLAALAAPGWELIRSLTVETRDTEVYELSPYETFVQSVVALLVAGIWFYLGASFGSFLNVVVYRLPLGKPLFLERSHCPGCKTRILFRDNLPVVGWLKLGGSCRNCHQPISIRYPLVEIAVGLYFLVFYFRELLSGGANLPLRPTNTYTGIVWVLFYTKWDLLGVYLFHCLLFCLLLAMTLPRLDGRSLPLRWLFVFLLTVIALLAINPNLFPLSWKPASGLWAWPTQGLLSQIVMGTLLGAGLGWGIGGICKSSSLSATTEVADAGVKATTPRTLVFSGAILGSSLGWQTVLLITGVGVVAWGITRLIKQSLFFKRFLASPEIILLLSWPLLHYWWRELATLCFGN